MADFLEINRNVQITKGGNAYEVLVEEEEGSDTGRG